MDVTSSNYMKLLLFVFHSYWPKFLSESTVPMFFAKSQAHNSVGCRMHVNALENNFLYMQNVKIIRHGIHIGQHF